MSTEAEKDYARRYYLKHREKLLQARREYQETHRKEINARRRKHYHEVEKLSDDVMDKRRDKRRENYRKNHNTDGNGNCIVTKEEWLKKYGYPMGDTTGWEHWLGWDNRIRRSEE